MQLESFNLIGLISKGSGNKEERVGSGKEGCVLSTNPDWAALQKKPVACSLGIMITVLGVQMLGEGRRTETQMLGWKVK